MDLGIDKSINQGKYTVLITTDTFSEADTNLMQRFGEPVIETGGTFSLGAITFSLPTNPRQVNNGFPVTQIFDVADHSDAEDRANIWAITISNRIRQGMITLRANVDSFSGKTVENV